MPSAFYLKRTIWSYFLQHHSAATDNIGEKYSFIYVTSIVVVVNVVVVVVFVVVVVLCVCFIHNSPVLMPFFYSPQIERQKKQHRRRALPL